MDVSLIAPIFYQPEEAASLPKVLLEVHTKFSNSPWYQDIIFFLQHIKCPDHLEKSQARYLNLKAIKYYIIDGNLYWKGPGGILLNCVIEEKIFEIINEFHRGICGGHQAWRATAYKILWAGYYWPTLFQETNARVRACPEC